MLEAPSPPEDAQYSELGLRFVGMQTSAEAGLAADQSDHSGVGG
jgi:hypothetical protein